MTSTRDLTLLRLDTPPRIIALICGLTLAVGTSEALLFKGHVLLSIWAYSLLLVAISLAPIYLKGDVALLQAFGLIAVFRLVNFSVPVFFERTLFWIPFVYAPLVPVVVFLSRQTQAAEQPVAGRGDSVEAATRLGPATRSRQVPAAIRQDLPWWLGGRRGRKLRRLFERGWRFCAVPEDASFARVLLQWVARGLLVVFLPVAVVVFLGLLVVLTVYLAEFESAIITPTPLIPSLAIYHLTMLAVIMVVFVGFVEELLFRGVLQKVLERHLGLVPGLLLASGLFGLIYSVHGVPMEFVFASGIGLLFGVLYDATESLVLVSCLHGLLNVLLFGIIPLGSASPTALLHVVGHRELERAGLRWVIDAVSLLDVGVLTGVV